MLRVMSQVGDLRSLAHLIRLDLSNNGITDTGFADGCQTLKWLSLAKNPITSLQPLQCLTNLQACTPCILSFFQKTCNSSTVSVKVAPGVQVLNVAHAKLTGEQDIGGLTSLGALIINDNRVTSLAGESWSWWPDYALDHSGLIIQQAEGLLVQGRTPTLVCTCDATGLEQLPNLNTLVAKQNAIADLGACLLACSGLQKLSMAHNALSSLGGCLAGCTQVLLRRPCSFFWWRRDIVGVAHWTMVCFNALWCP